jgi:hypothetical protein
LYHVERDLPRPEVTDADICARIGRLRNARRHDGRLLIEAARSGREAVVRYLLKLKVPGNSRQCSAFHAAVDNGHLGVAALLPGPSERDELMGPSISAAVLRRDAAAVRLLAPTATTLCFRHPNLYLIPHGEDEYYWYELIAHTDWVEVADCAVSEDTAPYMQYGFFRSAGPKIMRMFLDRKIPIVVYPHWWREVMYFNMERFPDDVLVDMIPWVGIGAKESQFVLNMLRRERPAVLAKAVEFLATDEKRAEALVRILEGCRDIDGLSLGTALSARVADSLPPDHPLVERCVRERARRLRVRLLGYRLAFRRQTAAGSDSG